MIEIEHNIEPSHFKWLWAKYVVGLNANQHCTHCIRGPYSKLFSKHNPSFGPERVISLNERPVGSYVALYICGVASRGYPQHRNYPHNIHAAIVPEIGGEDLWEFERWQMRIRNGRLVPIPQTVGDLPERYRLLEPRFTTCRIFRWAVCFFED